MYFPHRASFNAMPVVWTRQIFKLNVFRESSHIVKKITFQMGSTCSFLPTTKMKNVSHKRRIHLGCVSVRFLECQLLEGCRACSVTAGWECWGLTSRGWACVCGFYWMSHLVPHGGRLHAHDNTFHGIINLLLSSLNPPKISTLVSEEKSYVKFM